MEKVTETWRAVLEAYKNLKENHEVFCKTAEGVDLNQAGPGLREALQMLYHKRKFMIFLEDLMYEDFRKGGTDRLLPPVLQEPEEEKEEEKENAPPKIPSSFKGKKSSTAVE